MKSKEFFLLGFRIRRVKAYPQGQAAQISWRISRGGRLIDSFLSRKRAIKEVKKLGLIT